MFLFIRGLKNPRVFIRGLDLSPTNSIGKKTNLGDFSTDNDQVFLSPQKIPSTRFSGFGPDGVFLRSVCEVYRGVMRSLEVIAELIAELKPLAPLASGSTHVHT